MTTFPYHVDPIPELSVVVPAYNEEETVARLCQEVCAVLVPLGMTFEIVIVDDGSSDRTLEELRELHRRDSRIHYVSLSRNFGQQGGFVAGLEQCRASGAIITMDADLQHPPSLFPEMIRLWREGYDVVNTFQSEEARAGVSHAYVFGRRLYYRLLAALAGLDLARGQNEFRLMDRRALQALLSMPEQAKYLRGMTAWVGFRQTGIAYRLSPRVAGCSKFIPKTLSLTALDSILSFSRLPLWLFAALGLVVSLGALIQMILYPLMAWLQFKAIGVASPPNGVLGPTAMVLLFLGGVQLVGLGMLGEYVGYILREVKRRPVYLIRESTLPPRGAQPPSGEALPERSVAAFGVDRGGRAVRSRLPIQRRRRRLHRYRTPPATGR
ncbi:MAG: glycosyltransferase family 2 protein [Magnetococcales bacterium]|nr:glycosyltransferase family 2 protein [Magnetococcales bacterium]